MNADFLVLKVQDEVGSLDELMEGEPLPMGTRTEVMGMLENALPSIDWNGASGLWWSGEVFSVEAVLPAAEEVVRSVTLKVRLNPAMASGPLIRADEAELETFLLALCDPQGWSLFELGSGRAYRFSDEVDVLPARSSKSSLRSAGLVN